LWEKRYNGPANDADIATGLAAGSSFPSYVLPLSFKSFWITFGSSGHGAAGLIQFGAWQLANYGFFLRRSRWWIDWAKSSFGKCRNAREFI